MPLTWTLFNKKFSDAYNLNDNRNTITVCLAITVVSRDI